ncbi:MAG: galactose-1-phosphate uridylyltransferase [candidate division Zixibacteria bacterium]|nr:galactose-1-phosphate uridylyltransferase [candidate division Zixibacteria bacterium]
MPELRKDPIIGRWVIISTERGKRPSDFTTTFRRKENSACPFCPGNESATPPEILAFRPTPSEPNKPGWTLRVIPNKYPALRIEGDLNREGKGIYDKMNGIGAHEVIIETTDHSKDMPDFEEKEVEDIIWAYIQRIKDLSKDPRFGYILIFKNQGEEAGASLEHSHSQLIATPVVPKRVTEEVEKSKAYFNYKERCIFCDIIRQEISENERMVVQNDFFIALEPFAPRFPFETWILPKSHIAHFKNTKKEAVSSLAKILKETLKRLSLALNNPPYNYMIHTSPVGESDEIDHYHWHIEIIPKLTRVAGFEWGTGFYINPTSPEDAAKYLNEVKIPTPV